LWNGAAIFAGRAVIFAGLVPAIFAAPNWCIAVQGFQTC
jgi:hypothetical protein